MATEKQIEANRRNAAKSTGPRSPEGKARSSMNALKSGVDAEAEIIPGFFLSTSGKPSFRYCLICPEKTGGPERSSSLNGWMAQPVCLPRKCTGAMEHLGSTSVF